MFNLKKEILPPSTIRVCGYDIVVKNMSREIADAEGCFGIYTHGKQEIKIDFSVSNERVIDTLIHEINHAIWNIFGLDDEEDEEKSVNTLSLGLMQVFRDNPKLYKYIGEMLNHS